LRLPAFRQFLIHAHSVVGLIDGSIVDITPLDENERAWSRFLEHEGTGDEYARLKVQFAQLMHPALR